MTVVALGVRSPTARVRSLPDECGAARAVAVLDDGRASLRIAWVSGPDRSSARRDALRRAGADVRREGP